MKIKDVKGRQILDSRGNPTVEVDIKLDDDSEGRGISPSGASTGSLEALELRDDNKEMYNGKSVLKAVANVNENIKNAIKGKSFNSQEDFDNFLIDLDGSENKSVLGANAILSSSLAYAHASSLSKNIPLYKSFINNNYTLPVPMMNILNGGAHASNELNFQEFMILPIKFTSFSESLRAGAEIFHELKKLLISKNLNSAVGDEGGFAPNLSSNEDALDIILDAINSAGYTPGEDIFLGLDAASTEFYKQDKYILNDKNTLDSSSFCDYLVKLCDNYPIISIEDGMSEDDWNGWQEITERLGNKIQLVGDDIFVTNKNILQKGIDSSAANSILIKLNQIGTLTETLQTIDLAKKNHYTCIISHRSGETEDTTIADLSVGVDAGQIKTGSLSRSDRVAKYNRLLRIEEELGNNKYSNNVFNRWLS